MRVQNSTDELQWKGPRLRGRKSSAGLVAPGASGYASAVEVADKLSSRIIQRTRIGATVIPNRSRRAGECL